MARGSGLLPTDHDMAHTSAPPFTPPPQRHFNPPRSLSQRWKTIEIAVVGSDKGALKQLRGDTQVESSVGKALWRRSWDALEKAIQWGNPEWLGSDGPFAHIPIDDNSASITLAETVLASLNSVIVPVYWPGARWCAAQNDWHCDGERLRLVATFGSSIGFADSGAAAAIVYLESEFGHREPIWSMGHSLGFCTKVTAELAGAVLAWHGILDILSEG